MSEPLVNSEFEGFPIDYFKIKKEDFSNSISGRDITESFILNERNLSNITESIIEPNDEGKIYDSLREVIDITSKDTTVINASVGQGKTYSILKIVQEYLLDYSDTYIFIAVPFVSLVEQYYKELVELGIPENDIYRYEWLEPNHPKCTLESQIRCRIHIVTANCLLGNAGENSAINSLIKRNYLEKFSNYLKGEEYFFEGQPLSLDRIDSLDVRDLSKISIVVNSEKKKKAIFIYDEIHDAISNFKKNNVFNLFHWYDVIQKNIVISATYNDASIVVLKYLSSLTDNKLHIITSQRKIIESKQSKLFLHYNSNQYYKNKDSVIFNVVKDSIDRGLDIDILCYSKKLADEIFKAETETGGYIKEHYGEYVQLCASELISNQRAVRSVSPRYRYHSGKCNIGTNFKTGINIEKENHSYIIIFPPESSKMPFQNLFGIFSNGVNDIIQALARQRKVGEIHLILPPPETMDYSSLPDMNDVQKQAFIQAYNSVSKPAPDFLQSALNYFNRNRFSDEKVIYKSINYQTNIIKGKYEEFMSSILLPVIQHQNLEEFKQFLETPELDDFRILKGNKVLSKDKFLCADLSAFITYCAFTNQFINCRLESFYPSFIRFTGDRIKEDLQNKLYEIYETFLTENNFDLALTYQNLLDYIFDGNTVYLDNTTIDRSNYNIKREVLRFILNTENSDFFSSNHLYKDVLGDSFNHLNYLMHILAFIYNDRRTNNNREYPEGISTLYLLRERLKDSLVLNNDNKYLITDYRNNDIFQEIDLHNMVSNLLNDYPLLKETSFYALSNKSEAEKKKLLYKYLGETLGGLGSSRKLAFSAVNLRKLNTPVLDVPFAG